nr:7-cyano-7-deazaguanine synthase QueC [Bacilli bacterium]
HYNVVEHQIVAMPFFRQIGKSALTDDRIEVPKDGVNPETIPVTYVPGRNLIFLSMATAYAETVEASAIFIGVNALDYSGYPDCRTEFIEAFQHTAQIATKTGVQGVTLSIETPLQLLSKADIVRLGTRLNVPYSLTTSCYQGEEEACGECDSCRLRLEGFRQAGLVDPIVYRKIITR